MKGYETMNYPWKEISPRDTLQISQSRLLSDLDKRTVVSLYQPLTSIQAVSLYFLMNEYVVTHSSPVVFLSDILSQLDIGIKEFYEARIKLEAYGLLNVFQHSENRHDYKIAIEAPMTPEQFFSDPLLSMLLTEKVGQRLVIELEDRFTSQKIELEDYVDITKSFGDVVHVNMDKMSQTVTKDTRLTSDVKPLSLSEQVMKESDFDWAFFKEGINRQFVSTASIDASIKKLIFTFHTIYGINELDMQRFVLEAADVGTGQVSESKLTRLIQDHYLHSTNSRGNLFEEEEKTAKEQTFRLNELKQKGYSTEEIEIILHAEQTKPYAYLESIKEQKGGFVSSNESWVLKELIEQAPLSAAVINILINYVLIIKNSPTLDKGFAMKIANDWAQKQVKSPEEAMQKVKELYASTQASATPKSKASHKGNQYSNRNVRKETLPEWAYETERKDEPVSNEVEQAFKERLKRIRQRKSGEQ